MLDQPMPADEQLRRFGFSWDTIPGFGEMDFWSFYQELVRVAPPDSQIVEIGCYHGRSLICLGAFAREANKGLRIVGIDNDDMGATAALRQNLAKYNLPIEFQWGDSVQVARRVPDESCFAVFIDGAHLHDQVAADIRAWMPKVTHWLAGHDFLMHTVYEPVVALFEDKVIYDERWRDIWIVPKCDVLNDVDIRAPRAALMPFKPWAVLTK